MSEKILSSIVEGVDSKVVGGGVVQAVNKATRENPRVDVKMHLKGAMRWCGFKGFAPKKGVAGGWQQTSAVRS